jgi:hypothetical protein
MRARLPAAAWGQNPAAAATPTRPAALASVNLAVRIRMYFHNKIDICMYLTKNTAIYLHFFKYL